MADQEQDGLLSLTVPVVMTFPNLLEAKSVQRGGKSTGDPKFSANFEFNTDHPDFPRVRAKILELANAKWPGRNFGAEAAVVDASGLKRIPTFLFPLTAGDKLADKAKENGKDREFSRGKVVLVSRSKYEPGLAVIDGGAIVDLEGPARVMAKSKFYSGVEVLAQFNFQAYDGVGETGADGVTAYLNKVLSTNKGTKLAGGGSSAADVFKGYIGTSSAVNPLGATEMNDEIPF